MSRDELKLMWQEQKEFNKLFMEPPKSLKEQTAASKDYVIGLYSEVDELMREIPWKPHRADAKLHNPEQVRNELSDILKYWVSLCIVWGVTPEDAIKDFWRKSMVCRQRYSQEYVLDMNGRIALVDIDGVLADWHQSFKQFSNSCHPASEGQIKHEFRSSGAKSGIPVFSDAKPFLDGLRDAGIMVVLHTSRPIDRYPNLLGTTIQWLAKHKLPFDAIWWSDRKASNEKLKTILDQIVFAVDDDYHHVIEYEAMGIPGYHLNRDDNTPAVPGKIYTVGSLEEIEYHV